MSGQIKSKNVKFSNSKFSYKTYLLCPLMSQDSKKSCIFTQFLRMTIRNAKIAFQKVTSSYLGTFFFFAIAQSKINILLSNLVCL